jgi:hypothetical protein
MAKRKTVGAVGSSRACIDKAKGRKGAENEGVRRQVSICLRGFLGMSNMKMD